MKAFPKKDFNRRIFFVSLLLVAVSAFAEPPAPSPVPASVPGTPAPAAYRLPAPVIEVLPNGLTLAWFRSDAIPVVDLGLVVRSGARHDPAGKSGTAELLSSLLDRGAGGLNAQEFSRAIESLGASRGVSADEDTITVGMHGLAPDAPALLDLFARMVLRPEFSEAEFSKTHARILDQWRRMADYGEPLVNLVFQRLLSAGTPYGRGSFLSEAEFRTVTRADAVKFHHDFFVPGNSVLMVVGRVDPAEFRPKILSAFGGWTGSPAAAVTSGAKPSKPVVFADRRLRSGRKEILVVDRPGLPQAQVRIGFRAPLIRAPEHYPLSVANALLGEHFESRLNSLVRDKLGLTYAISSSYSYLKDLAIFSVSSSTRNESVPQLVGKVMGVLSDLRSGEISEDEVRTAKEYLVGGFPLGTSTLGAVASRWLSGYVFELGPDYLNEYVPRISAVTLPEVRSAVSRTFDVPSAVIVVSGDASQIIPSLKKLNGYRITKVNPASLR